MTLNEINIDGLIKKVLENKVEITINLDPGHTDIQITPWKPFGYQCPFSGAAMVKNKEESE